MTTTSGWEQWEDLRARARHFNVTLTDQDAMLMDPAQLAMLEEARTLIELAFAKDTPRQLAELRAEKGRPRRVSELSPDELRGLLARTGGTA